MVCGPGQEATVDERAFGYPVRSLAELKAGEYYVQAVLHRYETFHRSDGHTVKLPMDRGEGQHWNLAPGNLYSKPMKIELGRRTAAPIAIVLDQEIPPIPAPKDTKYIRHVSIHSELLRSSGDARCTWAQTSWCPRVSTSTPRRTIRWRFFTGTFPADFEGFRTEPPDPNLKPDYSERFHLAGYNRIEQEEAYKFYQQWISPELPAHSRSSKSSTPIPITTTPTR